MYALYAAPDWSSLVSRSLARSALSPWCCLRWSLVWTMLGRGRLACDERRRWLGGRPAGCGAIEQASLAAAAGAKERLAGGSSSSELALLAPSSLLSLRPSHSISRADPAPASRPLLSLSPDASQSLRHAHTLAPVAARLPPAQSPGRSNSAPLPLWFAARVSAAASTPSLRPLPSSGLATTHRPVPNFTGTRPRLFLPS